MPVSELLPILSGLCLGALLGALRPTLRIWTGVVLAVALGVLATVISGEFRITWAFLLIDIPLVAFSAALGLLAIRRLGWTFTKV
jgi:hypothetical protein